MLRPRIIPCLLVQKGGLVKTVRFTNPKYEGDPINAVRIFNEKEVDELILLDIDATVHNREPDYSLIRKIAVECRMPLCYGGGVRNVEQVDRIISLGVEKVALSATAVAEPRVIEEAAKVVGAQSIVVIVDVKRQHPVGNYRVYTHNGRIGHGIDPLGFVRKIEALGAGEVVLNSIDRDGTMSGYDLDLPEKIRKITALPMTVLGGAGSLKHIARLYERIGICGAAAGSLFVFKGRYRAVLINYPDRERKDSLFGKLVSLSMDSAASW